MGLLPRQTFFTLSEKNFIIIPPTFCPKKLIPLLHGAHSGDLLLSPQEQTVQAMNTHYQLYEHEGPAGSIRMQLYEGQQVQVCLTRIALHSGQRLCIRTTGYPYTLIGILQNSVPFSIPSQKRILLHERGFNLAYTPDGYRFDLHSKEQYLLLSISYSTAFIEEQIELQPEGMEFFREANLNRGLYFSRQAITDRPIMHILGQLLFTETWQGYAHFFIRQIAQSLFQRTTQQSSLLRFQPASVSLEEARWFYGEKAKLLRLCLQQVPYSVLLQKAGIRQVRRFRTRIQQLYGISIQQFITESRLSYSLIMLRETELPLKVIAVQSGFKTLYYFARVFRDYYGINPGAFRREEGL